MSLFAIADLHLSLGVDKPMDIFGARWENAVEKLENNWRAKITDADTVVIAGDVSWGMTAQEALPDLQFLNRLPGKKLLMKGNHDYWWSTLKKLHALLEEHDLSTIDFLFNNAYPVGEKTVCGSRGWNIFGDSAQDNKLLRREVMRLEVSCKEALQTGGEPVVFMHYPPLSPMSSCTLFSDVLSKYGIKKCYYGHLHAGGKGRAFEGVKDGVTYQLISADVIQFNPVLVDEKA